MSVQTIGPQNNYNFTEDTHRILYKNPNNLTGFLNVELQNQKIRNDHQSLNPELATKIRESALLVVSGIEKLETLETKYASSLQNFTRIKTVISKPYVLFIAIIILGLGIYYLATHWNKNSKAENQKSLQFLFILLAAISSVFLQSFKNFLVSKVGDKKIDLKDKQATVIESKGHLQTLLSMTQISEQFAHVVNADQLLNGIVQVEGLLRGNAPGTKTLTPALSAELGKLKMIVNHHIDHSLSEQPQKDEEQFVLNSEDKEACSHILRFIEDKFLPMIEAETHSALAGIKLSKAEKREMAQSNNEIEQVV